MKPFYRLPLLSLFLLQMLICATRASVTTFTTSGTWTVPTGVTSVEVLVVGGGGGGGGNCGGGGGGGGVIHNTSFAVTSGASVTVTIGAGGSGSLYNGSGGGNSVFGSLTAIGGGGGATYAGTGGNGGSGGGGGSGENGNAYPGSGGSGTSGQGYAGGTGLQGDPSGTPPDVGGGGGGAGGAGSTSGGGAAISLLGGSYAGGGGGGGYPDGGTSSGGGGAGAGAVGDFAGANATANSGSGGGGGGCGPVSPRSGGNGGSGIVVVVWTATVPPSITSSLSVTGETSTPFSFGITATNGPTSFGATGLPSGLSLNSSTGVISGTPSATGIFNVAISATNAAGTGNATLVLTVLESSSTTFTSSGLWTVPTGVTSVELLIVGGGGGSGTGNGGGGGGGDVVAVAAHTVSPGANLTVTVGAGGARALYNTFKGSNGSDSAFDTVTAKGGGGGGSVLTVGGANGSGGQAGGGGGSAIVTGASGGGGTQRGGAGTTDGGGTQAAAGGGGGGGASGGTGTNGDYTTNTGGNGGNGTLSGITGSWTYYGGGGGGGSATNGGGGQGGGGGGGNGAANTGGGGGGAAGGGGVGGSGIVIVKWIIPAPVLSSSTAATVGANTSFSYSIVANNGAFSYSASGLPSGLSLNTSTGAISGAPTTTGTYSVTLGATNATGTGNATLSLSVVASSTLPNSSDFESGSGYSSGDVNGQQAWLGTASLATVSTADAHGGSRSLKLDAGGVAATATKYFDGTGSPSVAFLDLYVKPVAASTAAGSSLVQTESASVGFQISSGQGEIYAFDGVGANQWVGTGIKFALNGSNQATSWLRLTLREDYTHHTWDLYVNGVLADYDLAFSSNSESCLRILTLKGHASAATYVDDVVAQSANPLFTDADKDGMPDSWETANGLNTAADDRNSDHDGDGLNNIEEYFAGTAANNADTTNPTAATGLHAVGSSVAMTLTWTAGTDSGSGTSGVAGYNIYRGGVKVNSSLVTATSFTDTGLSASTAYSYTVRTVDLAGNVSTDTSVSATTAATGSLDAFTPLDP